ncbi:apoptosis facilitator Bcl-2-like protein 14 [Solea solea]|uniref:apoptosis facilitator Bcl-2-like protein 14 n=1 Tax=Solea solea TaxID=90069 RepID=UPI00272965F5|nr:apoptosis facilitator Bcl-2-like protein 14 [Solea solea]
MANGHVEIHDPFTNGLKSSGDDGGDADDASGMEDTVEFRIMMAYATRRRVKENGSVHLSGTVSPQTPLKQYDSDSVTEEKKKMKKKKKKRGMKGLKRLFSCVKPRTSDEESEPQLECGGNASRRFAPDVRDMEEMEEMDKLEEAAVRLIEIADEIPFVPSDLQTDNPEDNVERLIGLLLREAGDRLDERELRDVSLARELFWNYSFFKTLITELLMRMGLSSSDPESPGPRASPTTQIAVTCEATNRLTALQTLPMNRLLGYGARFLNENYSSWVQEQGGYEDAFESDDEDEVH